MAASNRRVLLTWIWILVALLVVNLSVMIWALATRNGSTSTAAAPVTTTSVEAALAARSRDPRSVQGRQQMMQVLQRHFRHFRTGVRPQVGDRFRLRLASSHEPISTVPGTIFERGLYASPTFQRTQFRIHSLADDGRGAVTMRLDTTDGEDLDVFLNVTQLVRPPPASAARREPAEFQMVKVAPGEALTYGSTFKFQRIDPRPIAFRCALEMDRHPLVGVAGEPDNADGIFYMERVADGDGNGGE